MTVLKRSDEGAVMPAQVRLICLSIAGLVIGFLLRTLLMGQNAAPPLLVNKKVADPIWQTRRIGDATTAFRCQTPQGWVFVAEMGIPGGVSLQVINIQDVEHTWVWK